jgi:hypothetical protein
MPPTSASSRSPAAQSRGGPSWVTYGSREAAPAGGTCWRRRCGSAAPPRRAHLWPEKRPRRLLVSSSPIACAPLRCRGGLRGWGQRGSGGAAEAAGWARQFCDVSPGVPCEASAGATRPRRAREHDARPHGVGDVWRPPQSSSNASAPPSEMSSAHMGERLPPN